MKSICFSLVFCIFYTVDYYILSYGIPLHVFQVFIIECICPYKLHVISFMIEIRAFELWNEGYI
jgi:hypothetical protein